MEAFILAGGASRRMGTDKSQLLIERQTFAERIAETLLQVAESVKLVGGLGANYARVADIYPQWGALGDFTLRSPRAKAIGPSWSLAICLLLLLSSSRFSRLSAWTMTLSFQFNRIYGHSRSLLFIASILACNARPN